MNSHKHLRFLGMGLAGCAFVAGGVIAVSGPSTASSDRELADRIAAAEVKPVDGSLGRYSVFARPATAADTRAALRVRDDGGTTASNYEQVRVVDSDRRRTIAAVPGQNGPCLVVEYSDGSGGQICAHRGRTSAVSGYDGSIGIVPDTVKAVRFTMADGRSVDGPVIDNVWRSPADAARVSIPLPGGAQEMELLPAGSRPKGTTLLDNGVVTNNPKLVQP